MNKLLIFIILIINIISYINSQDATPCNNFDYQASTNGRGVCTSYGDEDTLIPIYLNGIGEGGASESYVIASLPSDGTLYKVDSSDPTKIGDAVATMDEIFSSNTNQDPPLPNLLFQPDPDYFNEILDGATPKYTYLDGLPINDCVSSSCPIEFSFTIMPNSDTVQATGTYSIYVDAVIEETSTIIFPEELNLDEVTDSVAVSGITIDDADSNEFQMGIVISPTTGKVKVDSLSIVDQVNGFVLSSSICEADDFSGDGCSTVYAYGYKSNIQKILTNLKYIPENVGQSDSIYIAIYKPFTDFATAVPVDEARIYLKDSDAPAPFDPNKKVDDTIIFGLDTASVAGIGAVIFLVLILFGWIIYSRCCKRNYDRYDDHKSYNSDLESQRSYNSGSIKNEPHNHKHGGHHKRNHSNYSSQGSQKNRAMLSDVDSPDAKAPTNARDDSYDSDNAVEVTDDSIFDWEKHIDKATGDVYFFNPKTGQSQWEAPVVKAKKGKK